MPYCKYIIQNFLIFFFFHYTDLTSFFYRVLHKTSRKYSIYYLYVKLSTLSYVYFTLRKKQIDFLVTLINVLFFSLSFSIFIMLLSFLRSVRSEPHQFYIGRSFLEAFYRPSILMGEKKKEKTQMKQNTNNVAFSARANFLDSFTSFSSYVILIHSLLSTRLVCLLSPPPISGFLSQNFAARTL